MDKHEIFPPGISQGEDTRRLSRLCDLQSGSAVASGTFNLEALKTSTLPALELRKQLLTINGVGPYAAANLLLSAGTSSKVSLSGFGIGNIRAEILKS